MAIPSSAAGELVGIAEAGPHDHVDLRATSRLQGTAVVAAPGDRDRVVHGAGKLRPGTTGRVKLTEAPAASPDAMAQVTVCPAAEQPAGRAPSVSPSGTLSVSVTGSVVATVPSLVTVNW